MVKTRSRLVNFRVTDEELRRLKTASALEGARCLSDFIRSLVLESVRGFAPAPEHAKSVTDQMSAFDHRLVQLESNVARLIGAVETALRNQPLTLKASQP